MGSKGISQEETAFTNSGVSHHRGLSAGHRREAHYAELPGQPVGS